VLGSKVALRFFCGFVCLFVCLFLVCFFFFGVFQLCDETNGSAHTDTHKTPRAANIFTFTKGGLPGVQILFKAVL
jgi:hypothetical protein